uniref:Murine retrovirus integration site 1 homolog n=1 Tax=Nothobranchius furzeri TaxID=105023 RepID=A0A8C6LBU1_NOTFU
VPDLAKPETPPEDPSPQSVADYISCQEISCMTFVSGYFFLSQLFKGLFLHIMQIACRGEKNDSCMHQVSLCRDTGNVIDLLKDQLPELQLSEEDRQKNLELLEQAKKVSDRFLTRRGRRSSSSLTESPTGLSPPLTPSSSPRSSRNSSVIGCPLMKCCGNKTLYSFFIAQEHKLMRNQSIVGSMLPDLSEAAEQDKGRPSFSLKSTNAEESKEKSDAMPNISDVMLRKLKLHRGLPGCAPPLTEKEVENAFVQLSLAFRNDNYTLETRLKQAERERTLTEENTEKELEEFKTALKWQNMEQREAYQRLVETVAVLLRLTTRLSSRAEIVGAVRQEKRMNKATEVMMQYVENLRRTYEKDHAELMEFKKHQNSNRYGGSPDNGGEETQVQPTWCYSLLMLVKSEFSNLASHV